MRVCGYDTLRMKLCHLIKLSLRNLIQRVLHAFIDVSPIQRLLCFSVRVTVTLSFAKAIAID